MATGVGKSNYLENAVLNHFLKGSAAVAQPTAIYVGLFTDAAGLANDQPATELVGTGYARQSVSFGVSTIGTTNNTAAVTFTAGGAWLKVNYLGIFDALTGGNMLYWGAINPNADPNLAGKTLANTDQLQFPANQIVISED